MSDYETARNSESLKTLLATLNGLREEHGYTPWTMEQAISFAVADEDERYPEVGFEGDYVASTSNYLTTQVWVMENYIGPEEEDYEDDWSDDDGLSDGEADAMTLASCGMGTDEDYGFYGYGDEW